MVEVIQIHYNILTENQCALAIVTKSETRASPMESLFLLWNDFQAFRNLLLWRSKCLYNLYRMKFVLRRRRMKRRRRRRRRAPEAWLSGKLLPSPYLHTAPLPILYYTTLLSYYYTTIPYYTFTLHPLYAYNISSYYYGTQTIPHTCPTTILLYHIEV